MTADEGCLSPENLTLEERWGRCKNATAAVIEKLPRRKRKQQLKATRSDAQKQIHERIEKLHREQGIRSDPQYKTMRRRYQKEKNDAALDGYRQWARDICEEAVEADRCNDGKTLYPKASSEMSI